MKIVFSMDGIKNMDQLYTKTIEYSEDFDCEGEARYYHGSNYCKAIIDSLTGWMEKKYNGSRERFANETFSLVTSENNLYTVSFAISTYEDNVARLEVSIIAPDTDNYDHKLEELKIALKNKLILDWKKCTWLVDEQAVSLCKDAYEQAFTVENNLRAFSSKVLMHFLGVNWLNSFGFEKIANSVYSLKNKFVQRVPEFDNINTDFLSMTLETLVKVIFKGVIYKEIPISVGKEQYLEIQNRSGAFNSGYSILDYLTNKLTIDKKIWNDLFVPYIDEPDGFQTAVHDFIEDRNHIAHSKVLSWSSYVAIKNDFNKMEALIHQANTKFDNEETSEEMSVTLEAMHEEEIDDSSYFRDRLSSETGMEILDEGEIVEWFDEVLHELYSKVYQRYHLDMEVELSDFSTPDEGNELFSVVCSADEETSITVYAKYWIDDELGGNSTCDIVAKNTDNDEICRAEIRFQNGNGFENEDGLMEADESTEYDTTELEDFKKELYSAIGELNPYPAQAELIAYRNKGAVQVLSDYPCQQCGKFGISLNVELLPIGKCCYCGWENELKKCERCGELVSADVLENGFCPSCSEYIEKQ